MTFGQYLRNILGVYTPTGDSFGGADWQYIFSGILLIVFVYSMFKLIGKLIK